MEKKRQERTTIALKVERDAGSRDPPILTHESRPNISGTLVCNQEARVENANGAAKCPILRPRHGLCLPPAVAPAAAEVATSSRFQRV